MTSPVCMINLQIFKDINQYASNSQWFIYTICPYFKAMLFYFHWKSTLIKHQNRVCSSTSIKQEKSNKHPMCIATNFFFSYLKNYGERKLLENFIHAQTEMRSAYNVILERRHRTWIHAAISTSRICRRWMELNWIFFCNLDECNVYWLFWLIEAFFRFHEF